MLTKPLHGSTLCLGFLLLAGWTSTADADHSTRTLFNFDDSDSLDGWKTVNDGVMGGVSDGRRRTSGDGSMEFFGNLSLDNNGGFASVRSQAASLPLGDDDVIVARVRGDGREYYLNLRTSTPRMAFSYRASFQTVAGQWQEIRIPVSEFRATWFGRRVPNATLDATSVNSIGFLLADKIPGAFRLEIDWINVESRHVRS